jgi:hypothetical protein
MKVVQKSERVADQEGKGRASRESQVGWYRAKHTRGRPMATSTTSKRHDAIIFSKVLLLVWFVVS